MKPLEEMLGERDRFYIVPAQDQKEFLVQDQNGAICGGTFETPFEAFSHASICMECHKYNEQLCAEWLKKEHAQV